MATLSNSSTGTGWPISSAIDSLHKKKRRSSITFLRYNHIVTLICTPVPLLLVWRMFRNSSPATVSQTIELRTSSSNTEHRPQTYNTNLGSQTHKTRLTDVKKTHLKLFFFSSSFFPFLVILNFSFLQNIYLSIFFYFSTRLKIRISSFLIPPGRDLQKKVLKFTNRFNRKSSSHSS